MCLTPHDSSWKFTDEWGNRRHIEFIKSHHHKIKRVAFVTDSKTAKITQSLVHHFIHADIQNFAYDEFDEARKWVSNK
jgi:hypothetical protein